MVLILLLLALGSTYVARDFLVCAQDIVVTTQAIVIPVTKDTLCNVPKVNDLSVNVRTLGNETAKVEAYATDLFEEKGRSAPLDG